MDGFQLAEEEGLLREGRGEDVPAAGILSVDDFGCDYADAPGGFVFVLLEGAEGFFVAERGWGNMIACWVDGIGERTDGD